MGFAHFVYIRCLICQSRFEIPAAVCSKPTGTRTLYRGIAYRLAGDGISPLKEGYFLKFRSGFDDITGKCDSPILQG
jgi:hypothetical protein